jgi:hypothetical protein
MICMIFIVTFFKKHLIIVCVFLHVIYLCTNMCMYDLYDFHCWTHMRMYDFDFFRYICVLQCVISSHVYVISLFTYDTIFIYK